jgi:hypothetical protein
MLEDIEKLKEFKKLVTQAKRVTTFIYRYERIISVMREKTSGMDLIRSVATRFTTCFLDCIFNKGQPTIHSWKYGFLQEAALQAFCLQPDKKLLFKAEIVASSL